MFGLVATEEGAEQNTKSNKQERCSIHLLVSPSRELFRRGDCGTDSRITTATLRRLSHHPRQRGVAGVSNFLPPTLVGAPPPPPAVLWGGRGRIPPQTSSSGDITRKSRSHLGPGCGKSGVVAPSTSVTLVFGSGGRDRGSERGAWTTASTGGARCRKNSRGS